MGLCIKKTVHDSLCFLRFLLFKTESNTIHKRLNVPLGGLLNFHELQLVDGISRHLLSGANQPGTEGNEGNEERQSNP
jgi:hypothetical protein